MRIILKFGGSSLADTEKIRAAGEKIRKERENGHQVVAVVSAQGDTTDDLMAAAAALYDFPDGRELDALLATGEAQSAARMAIALNAMDCPAVSLTGPQAGIQTDGVWQNARITGIHTARLEKELSAEKAVIVAGFQGIGPNGDVVTLGRGGSDTTAVALAAYLKGDVCRIYTDVDGVYDKDPRKFPDAVKFSAIGYRQMLALARQGAQVLHDRCVELAMAHNVPVQVLSSFRAGGGTWVTNKEETVTETKKLRNL